MKFYGHANLQQNQLQNAVLPFDTNFPASPKIGQIAFVNSTVFICVSISGGLPMWVPMTREITAFTWNQSTASDTWNISHGLNTRSVQVQIFDNANMAIIPNEIELISAAAVKVTFAVPIVGSAVIITGHFDGNVKPTYAYTHYQASASTTWVIPHNLGYNPIIRVFVGNQEVQPMIINHDSTMQTTITFSAAQSGYARLI